MWEALNLQREGDACAIAVNSLFDSELELIEKINEDFSQKLVRKMNGEFELESSFILIVEMLSKLYYAS